MTQPERVCAIVVTFNRKELLRECLCALQVQSYPLAHILVIDNLSDDGTVEMLGAAFRSGDDRPAVEVKTLPQNMGGAGGFHEGMKAGIQSPYDWLWLMDDDTIAAPDALKQLLAARTAFPEARRPVLLGSKVLWTDGSLHPTNLPWPKMTDAEQTFMAAEHGTFALRSTTFVSMLLRREVAARHQLPIAEYFLGSDDVEYTARILRDEFGVAVPASLVIHKTPLKPGTNDAPPAKFYLYVRNTTWMLSRSKAFRGREAIKLGARFLLSLVHYLQHTRFAAASWAAIAQGLQHGILRAPKR